MCCVVYLYTYTIYKQFSKWNIIVLEKCKMFAVGPILFLKYKRTPSSCIFSNFVKALANLISAENANQNKEKMILTFIWERHLSQQQCCLEMELFGKNKISQQKASLKMPQLLRLPEFSSLYESCQTAVEMMQLTFAVPGPPLRTNLLRTDQTRCRVLI